MALTAAALAIARGSAAYDQPQAFQTPSPAALKQLTLEELSQIEVTTPSKEPVSAFRSPVAIYVITGDDIRRSGATTIPDALRLAPGVEVARIDTSKWSVGIRGFGTRLSRSVLVLVDGRSVYTPLFAGTYWEVQDTLLEDIDHIEVIRGPGGTIWGPNAVNGVINIITKSTKDTQGTYASVGGGNEEQGFANVRYGGGNGKGLTYRLYAKGFTRGPEYHQDGDNFDDWRGVQGGFRMDWVKNDRDAFTVQGDIYIQEAGQRVALASYVPAFQRIVDDNAELSGGNLVARWTRKLKGENTLQLQTYYDRTNRFEPNLGERRDTFDLDFTLHTRAGKRHSFIYGAGARFSEGRFSQVASGLVFYPSNRLDYLLSGFFQDDVSIVRGKLVLSIGGKFLRTNFTDFNLQPSARLLWTPTSRDVFWAAFTRALRTPSRVEHDFYLSSYLGTSSTGVSQFARFNANPDFATEQLNGYELGYRRLISKDVFVDFAGFWNHYHDLFSQDLVSFGMPETFLPFPQPEPVPPHTIITAQFRNDLYGFTTGGEISPEWRPKSYWRLRGSYSYLNMNLAKAPGIAVGGTAEAVRGTSPRHEANAMSSLDVLKKLEFDVVFRYVSAVPTVRADAYSTADARAAWRFNSHIQFAVVGRNLLQPWHAEYAEDPGPPVGIRRSVFATLSWTR